MYAICVPDAHEGWKKALAPFGAGVTDGREPLCDFHLLRQESYVTQEGFCR